MFNNHGWELPPIFKERGRHQGTRLLFFLILEIVFILIKANYNNIDGLTTFGHNVLYTAYTMILLFLLKLKTLCSRFWNLSMNFVIFMINNKQIKEWNCWNKCSERERQAFFKIKCINLDNEYIKFLGV